MSIISILDPYLLIHTTNIATIIFIEERMIFMNNDKNSPLELYKLGNFTKNAVEQFEENIVTKHNYLESVDANLKNNRSK